ncbi:MAG: inorganic diphosphatase, partial [Gluconacetobacter diazotrophicus]|nr:inorganic diphosphatase [Gluconacetobacter diazotrophicus]
EVKEVSELPRITRDAIEHFFTRYKDLEQGKWVKVTGWEGSEAAAQVIRESLAAARKG